MSANCFWRNLRSMWLGVAVAALLPAALMAADRPAKKAGADAKDVELFKALEDGTIGVRVVMKDSKEGRLEIKNKTDKPLNVKLPEAFATVPVLAQIGGGVGAAGNTGGVQAGGGGMGGMGMGGMGGGMMYVAPERAVKAPFPAVCLEHGKADPRPSIPYEIKPIEQVSDKPEVAEVLRLLGKGQINQRAAQVATWHLNNNMSFPQLAAKRMKHANGSSEPYFNPLEIRAGMQVVAVATKLAEQRQKPASTSAN